MEELPALPDDQVNQLIALAVQSGVSVDNLERLLAMRRELKAEYAEGQYNKAMAAFQAACPIIQKKKYVPGNDGRMGYYFAPIDSIVAQVRSLLQQHGFSYSFDTHTDGDMVTAVCIAKHSDGHTGVPSTYTVPLSSGTRMMSTTQVTASALTFAKRYAFCNAFGIMTGDGDNDAKKIGRGKPQSIAPATLDVIEDMLLEHPDWYASIYTGYRVSALAELTEPQGLRLIAQLKQRVK